MGGSWTAVELNASNNSIDGLPGYTFPVNEWHTLRVDVAALGITDTVNALTVKAGGSNSIWYMDNVSLVPEPGMLTLAGIACLALLRRRRA